MPTTGEAHFDLGVAYKQSDNLPQARTELEEAVKLDPLAD